MANLRGVDGNLHLGGVIIGSAYVKGATAAGLATATLDGNGSTLDGVLVAGDEFTVAGDAQDPYIIVTGGVIGAVTENEVVPTFSPVIQEGAGWADNAAVTFATNSVSQIKSWNAEPLREIIDITTMQATGVTKTLDIPEWRGRAQCLMDYSDARQKIIIDQALAAAVPTAVALTLVATEGYELYGSFLASGFTVISQRGDIVTIEFNFEGTGALTVHWGHQAP